MVSVKTIIEEIHAVNFNLTIEVKKARIGYNIFVIANSETLEVLTGMFGVYAIRKDNVIMSRFENKDEEFLEALIKEIKQIGVEI